MSPRVVFADQERDVIAFAERAALFFEEDPKHWTFTDDDVAGGELFAVRWGMHDRAVLVFRLDDGFEPRIFGDLVRRAEDVS